MNQLVSTLQGCGNLAANDPTNPQSSGGVGTLLPMIPLIPSLQGCGDLAANDPNDLQSSVVWEPFCQ
jgi:hypothetical protein